MALRPYEEVVGPLTLPIRGKEYTLPAISREDGVRMHAAGKHDAELTITELTQIILGDAHKAMVDDGVPVAIIDRALWAGIADFQQGREGAELVWEHGAPQAVLDELQKTMQEAQQAAADSVAGKE